MNNLLNVRDFFSETVKPELTRLRQIKTSYDLNYFNKLIWKYIDMDREDRNRFLNRVIGTGLGSIGLLSWALMDLWDKVNFGILETIYLTLVSIMLPLWFILSFSYLIDRYKSAVFFTILAILSFILLSIEIALGNFLGIFLLAFMLSVYLIATKHYLNQLKKDEEHGSSIRVYTYFDKRVEVIGLMILTVLPIILFISRVDVENFGTNEFKLVMIWTLIWTLIIFSMEWFMQFLRLKKREIFHLGILKDITEGDITNPNIAYALFYVGQLYSKNDKSIDYKTIKKDIIEIFQGLK